MSDGKRINGVKKFMDGEYSPSEVHKALAWGGRRCDKCGAPSAIRIRVFAEYKEVLQRSPEFVMKLAADHNGEVPVVDFKSGKFIRVSEAFACAGCKQEAQREAAKAPSWCCVEIDEGPKDTMQVGA